ncbi:hypothetical protein HMSSN036_90690 [Paenibacillus macerans]|nr:hypothetical protein HMSSN036_90690 [Paenibacillus macerans]
MPETEKQTAIEAQNVVRKFGGQYAVNSVSFEVKQGEFVSLLGPSGCGKTTLLRMLGGLDRPDEGTILLAGRDVTKIPAYGRDTNMIFNSLLCFRIWMCTKISLTACA